ncbi:MAG: transglutaminase N-terminal domain-containing protein, partial [Terracidiphilus sp.]
MIYKIVHRTTYKYKYPVSMGSHVACLKPRSLPRHQLAQSELHIAPGPAILTERVDYFGNHQYFFTIEEPHDELIVEARSRVVIEGSAVDPHLSSISWEEVVKSLPDDLSPEALEAYQFRFESPRIRLRPEFARYAQQSFT